MRTMGMAAGSVVIGAHGNGDHLHVSVVDEGHGFAPEQLTGHARAFVTRRDTGTGLGLVMVRRSVEGLGGEFQFQNREPHGAHITLILSCADG